MMTDNYDSKILVSGAGSFIGKQLIRHLLSSANNKIVACQRPRSSKLLHGPALVYETADLLDFARQDALFKKHQPDYVFHLAAITRLGPAEENPILAVRTNYFGTKMLADLCIKHSVKSFMAVSSNLAREAESVVGLTKYLSEIYLRNQTGGKCKMVSFRMPNVPGSPGSVTELFKKQLISGGPITITDARMERRFIERDKAAELLSNCMTYSKPGDVFIMANENTNIADLAAEMIKKSGKDIKIRLIGAKAGEKLIEQKYEGDEIIKTGIPGLAVLKNDWQQDKVENALKKLKNKSENHHYDLLMKKLELSLQME
ncbi:MAG: polysaccharide biosynthesis protein [Chlorobi bacterium]|nr:polysaccharide biosynthesis protein [Chlorobiota bacterium]